VTPAPLRAMTPADLDAVLRLELELFGEEAWSRSMLAGELAQQPASRHYLVAVEAGLVIGYAGLLAAGIQADVVTIAVTSRRQGQGTGAALLEALLAEAARRDCTEVFLEVRVDNLRAQQLYRTRGFAQIGVRHGYYQPSGADALVMRLGLAAGADADGRAGRGRGNGDGPADRPADDPAAGNAGSTR
jgi:ribosomal-protein-alanine N-acetyltransferase